jgi:hypothetical protein
MPLLFSYGTLQEEPVQLATFGRRLDGQPDALPGFQRSRVKAGDDHVRATGRTHHDNVEQVVDARQRVPGTVFEVTDAELTAADGYEAPYHYDRIEVTLASGKRAWVYVYRPSRTRQEGT